MIKPRLVHTLLFGGAMALAASLSFAAENDYPNRSVEMIIPYPPGGSMDALARALQPGMSESLGQPVVVRNVGGAGGNLGTATTARSAPDGYTFVITTNAVVSINPHVYENVGFDPKTDFEPISLVATGPLAIGVAGDSDIHTLQDLIDKAKTEDITFASPGVASPHHLLGEFLNKEAGINMTHVPYKGIGPGITDMLGGHIDMAVSTMSGFMPFLKDGSIRVLAVAELEPYEKIPDVPTIAETYPGFEASAWFAALAPAGTPDYAAKKLNQAIVDALQDPRVLQAMDMAALIPVGSDPQTLVEVTEREYNRWGKVIEEAGIELE